MAAAIISSNFRAQEKASDFRAQEAIILQLKKKRLRTKGDLELHSEQDSEGRCRSSLQQNRKLQERTTKFLLFFHVLNQGE